MHYTEELWSVGVRQDIKGRRKRNASLTQTRPDIPENSAANMSTHSYIHLSNASWSACIWQSTKQGVKKEHETDWLTGHTREKK